MKNVTALMFSLLVFGPGTISRAFAESPVVSETFDAEPLSKNWAAAKGTWKIVDGKLKGEELASDSHPAVLFYKSPHTDSKVAISFQLDGSKGFSLSFNQAKGHLFRVIVSDNGVQIRTDKEKKDPSSKSEVLGRAEAPFEQGKLYTMTCQTKGDTVQVGIGDSLTIKGKHESLTRPKTGYRLVLAGKGVLFDDFQILSRD